MKITNNSQSPSRSRHQSQASPMPPPSNLLNLPSRGLFSSPNLSSDLGGARVYVCDHDTNAPEEQVIKTNTTNILIRSLQINKEKSDVKVSSNALTVRKKGKRSVRSVSDGRSAKRANTSSSSSSAQESINGFTESIIPTMTVERLRLLLRARGLSPKGRKGDLVMRLRDAV